MTRLRVVVLVIAVLATGLVVAPPAAAATGSISGTVTASAGGAGLDNVIVIVFKPNGTFVTEDLTAADGTYLLSGIAESVTGYSVCFDASNAIGGSSTTGYASECYNDI